MTERSPEVDENFLKINVTGSSVWLICGF